MTEADADRFFGRNDEIVELVTKLKRHRLIAVVADSGAGKSFLLRLDLFRSFAVGRSLIPQAASPTTAYGT